GGAALGTFGLAWAITDLVSKFGTLGLDTSAIAFVARAEAAGDRAGSRRIMRVSLAISLTAATLLAGLGCWFLGHFSPRFGQREALARAIAVTLLAMPGLVLYRGRNALSGGMAAMQHDIYAPGLTESIGTTRA